MISHPNQQYTPFNDPVFTIDEAVFLAAISTMAHRIESQEGYLRVIPDNEQSIGKLIERIQAPNQHLRTDRLYGKAFS